MRRVLDWREQYGQVAGQVFGALALALMIAWAGAMRSVPFDCEPTWWCTHFWICCWPF